MPWNTTTETTDGDRVCLMRVEPVDVRMFSKPIHFPAVGSGKSSFIKNKYEDDLLMV
jgi:hypothetical protein